MLSQEPREAAELEKPDSRRRRQSLVVRGDSTEQYIRGNITELFDKLLRT